MNERRLREAAGCTSLCALSASELVAMPMFHITHNGVSFSRQTRIDMYLIRTAEDSVANTMTAWLQAHHRGDTSMPFRYEITPGVFVEVPEWAE